MKELKVKIKLPTKQKKTEKLEYCINSIFTNTEDVEEIDKDNDGEIVQVIHGDHNYTTRPSGESSAASSTVSKNISVSKLGLSKMFDQGREKLVEMKIPLVRERK